MSSHTIVYLDQNYLSNMAKIRLGIPMDKGESEFWQLLFDDLRTAVLANKIACPKSEFHRREAQLNRRIEDALERIINELSLGLEFNPFDTILGLQIEDAACRFLGKSSPQLKTWSIAFNSDPQGSFKSRMENISGGLWCINVSFLLPQELVEQERQLKQEFAIDAIELLDKYCDNPLGWPELLLESKKSFVDGFIGERAQQSILR